MLLYISYFVVYIYSTDEEEKNGKGGEPMEEDVEGIHKHILSQHEAKIIANTTKERRKEQTKE